MCLHACLSLCLSGSLSVCVCLIVCLAVCMSVCLYVCMLVCLSVCMSVCMPVYLHVCTSACLHVRMSATVCLYVCMSVCMSMGVSFFAIYSKNLQATHTSKFVILCNNFLRMPLWKNKIQKLRVWFKILGHPVQKFYFALIKKIFLQPLAEIIFRYHKFFFRVLGPPGPHLQTKWNFLLVRSWVSK